MVNILKACYYGRVNCVKNIVNNSLRKSLYLRCIIPYSCLIHHHDGKLLFLCGSDGVKTLLWLDWCFS